MAAPFFFLPTDDRILEQIRKGEEEALVTLYRANIRMMTAFALRNNGTVDDAEDLLQESLVILWERVRSGRFELEAKLSTFLFATARNLWMRQLSRRRHHVALSDGHSSIPTGNPSALEEVVQQEEAERVRRAMDILGDPCRRLLLLFYWEERSMEQIAQEMHFANAEVAKSKKYQCKKALEKLLREE